MSTARLPLFFGWWPMGRSDTSVTSRTDRPAPRSRGPVFIHDAVTPFCGETLLLSRLRSDMEAGED